ncbi:hypothetical protein D3C87_1792030 [compost metagenome]
MTSMASAGAPSSNPRQSNRRNRSSLSGSCGRPFQTAAMASNAGPAASQNAQRQPSTSVQKAASGMPRLGANVAVKA